MVIFKKIRILFKIPFFYENIKAKFERKNQPERSGRLD